MNYLVKQREKHFFLQLLIVPDSDFMTCDALLTNHLTSETEKNDCEVNSEEERRFM
jgi:hypothetical protein